MQPSIATGFIVMKRPRGIPGTLAELILFRRLEITLQGWTGAHQVPVAEDIVDARHRWPIFVGIDEFEREERLLLAVGSLPVVE
jgi:hypothetical protein